MWKLHDNWLCSSIHLIGNLTCGRCTVVVVHVALILYELACNQIRNSYWNEWGDGMRTRSAMWTRQPVRNMQAPSHPSVRVEGKFLRGGGQGQV